MRVDCSGVSKAPVAARRTGAASVREGGVSDIAVMSIDIQVKHLSETLGDRELGLTLFRR